MFYDDDDEVLLAMFGQSGKSEPCVKSIYWSFSFDLCQIFAFMCSTEHITI